MSATMSPARPVDAVQHNAVHHNAVHHNAGQHEDHVADRDVPVAVAVPTRATYRRRRLQALAGLVLLVFVLTVVIGRAGAQAELDDPVAGHVVVEPGATLWDIAVDTAPEGIDPRQQLAALRDLNGLEGAHLDAWAVVLIPAR